MTENKSILLSICIPTYNRAGFLKEAIESILAQVDGTIADKIEIIISENASTDETAAVVERVRKMGKLPVTYFKNEQNVGFDRNILLVVERGRGQFAWILSDDDVLAPGALKRVMEELRGQDQADLYLGEKEDFYLTQDRPMRFRKIIRLPREKVFNFTLKETVNQYFKSNNKLIAYCNYLSNIIFNREKWHRLKDKEEFVGTEYIHLYVFQSLLWGREPGVMKYLPIPLVKRRWGNDTSVNAEERLKVDVRVYRRIAEAVFADKKHIRRIDELVLINDGFSWAVRLKISHRWRFYFNIFPILWRNYWDLPIFWFKIVPLLFMPNLVLRIMSGFYRKVVKGEPLSAGEAFK